MKIRINNIQDTLKLSRICEQFSENVDVTNGHFIVNGKSQMGLLSICTEPNLDIKIDTDDVITFGAFRNAISEFLTEGE